MTQIFNEKGAVIPVTVIEAGPCSVVQVKTVETDGYNAVQLGFGEVKEYKVNNIDKILDYINKYNIPAWNVLPIDPDIIIFDAPIKSIIFSYEKDNKINYYTIDFNMMIEPFGRDILNDFVKEFLLLKKKENLIKEYTKKE